MTTPADLYRSARHSARRLETLQRYTGTDDRRQETYTASGVLLPPQQPKQDDLALIASLRHRGLYVGRVHVVDRPLTDYLRYELAVYAENVAAGEDVLIADRSVHPDLAGLAQDFALFDSQAVVLFDYDDAGQVQGYRIADDDETVERCIYECGLAAARAVPVADFLVASRAA